MTDRPTAAELLEAVRELLEHDLLGDDSSDALDGRTRFHLRVAANALAIVERELTDGPHLAAEEQERLRTLLGQDGSLDDLNRMLAAGIRDRSLDDRRVAVIEHIRETLRAKLTISRPGYADGD